MNQQTINGSPFYPPFSSSPSCMRVLYKGSFKIKLLDQPIHLLDLFRKPYFSSYLTSVPKFGCILFILSRKIERMKT